MQQTDYRCNICNDLLYSEELSIKNRIVKSFCGFEFGPKNELLIKNFRNVHRHICYTCLYGLAIIFDNKIKGKTTDWMLKEEEKFEQRLSRDNGLSPPLIKGFFHVGSDGE